MRKFKKIFKVFILFLVLLTQMFTNISLQNDVKEVEAYGNNTGNLVVTVLSHEDDVGIADATFDLKDSTSRVVEQLETDSNGRIVVERLATGRYTLVQKTTGIGHLLPRQNEYEVNISNNTTTYRIITNNKRKASDPIAIDPNLRDSTTLRLKVLNSQNRSQGVAGAKFILKGDTVLVNNLVTSNDGSVHVPDLKYGTYSLVQVEAPDGYLPIDKEVTFDIPKPTLTAGGVRYAEFRDVQIDNIPYDKSMFGTLTVNVFDHDNHTTKIPNVTLRLTDVQSNKVYLGTSNSDGAVTFKGIVSGVSKTFKLEVLQAPYAYEGSNFKFEDTFIVPLTGRTQQIYLPKRPLRHLTINNYEKGDLSVRINGGTFKLYHEDGTSEEIQIGSDGVFGKNLPYGNYILEQLTSDGNHIVSAERIPFRLAREVELNIANELIHPENSKTEIKFHKIWVDQPKTLITSRIYLYANGEKTEKYIDVNSDNTSEHVFANLNKFDATHNTIVYSLKEEEIPDFYPVYEQASDGKITIKNYSGSQTGICAPPLVWMSTANSAYSFNLYNGIQSNQEIAFPNGAQYGQSLAYQKENTLLFAAGIEGGDDTTNTTAKLVVYDVSKGKNGKLLKTLSLGDLGISKHGYRITPVITGRASDYKPRHNKVNTMGISSDQKYIIVKHNIVPELYLYRISDILNATEGRELRPAKTINITMPHPNVQGGYKLRPLSDGDVVQYPNGDILFTGHHFDQLGDWSQRSQYKFYLVRYRGDTNDVATGNYGSPENVGTLTNLGQENTVTYTGGATVFEVHRNVEGMAIVSTSPGNYKLYVATNHGSAKLRPNGSGWDSDIKKGWSEIVIHSNGNSAMPGWQNVGGENFPFKLKPITVGTDVDSKVNSVNRDTPALITDMTAAVGDSCDVTVNIRGSKTWQGDTESMRPSEITVRLYADGVDTGQTQVVNKNSNWAYSFNNLKKYKLDANNTNTGTPIQYTVKEENVSKGYIFKQEEGTYNIVNILAKGKFTIKKMNKEKNRRLKGATFTLYNEDKSKIIATKVTNSDGIALFDNVPLGEYKLEETVAPQGYEISKQEYTVKSEINPNTQELQFKVYSNGVLLEKDGIDTIITNDNKKNAKLILDKKDDLGNALSGATFRLTRLDDSSYVEQTSGTNGQIVFENLRVGKYKLEETGVPTGFRRPTQTYEVTVTSDLKVLVSSVEVINTSSGFRSMIYSESLLGNTTLNRSIFRNALNNNVVTTISEPYYQDASPDTLNGHGVTTKQNIYPTTTKGRYKVDVEVAGNGMINEGSVYVFAIEKSKWTDKNINFNNILSDAFNKIRAKDPNAQVGVILSTRDTAEQVIYMTNVNNAINNINNIRSSYNDRSINGRNFGNVLYKAEEFFKLGNNATAKNKVLVQFMSTGIGGVEKRDIANQINDPLSKLRALGVTHKMIYQGSYENPSNYYNVPIETFSGNKQDFAKNKISEMINATNVGPGTVNIALNSNVVFDGFENGNNNLSAQGQQITASNISRRATENVEPHRFSYYVKSLTDNVTLNEFTNINTRATYNPYRSNPQVNVGIPIPKVAVPGLQFRVNKRYTDSVEKNLKESTVIKLLKNDTEVGRLALVEGLQTFNNVYPAFDNMGNDIVYRIIEENISNALISTILPETMSNHSGTFNIVTDLANLDLKVTKEWTSENTKPVKVRLIAKVNNQQIDISSLNYNGKTEKTITSSSEVKGELWSVLFSNLPRKTNTGSNITYEVQEIDVGGNTNPETYYKIEYFLNDNTIKVVNTEYTKITVTNYRSDIAYKFKIVKIDEAGNVINKSSIFSIDTAPTGDNNVYNQQIATLINGEFEFNNNNKGFKAGVYYLREASPPRDYLGLSGKIKIEITNSGELFIKDTQVNSNLDSNPLIVERGSNNLITIKVKNKKRAYDIKVYKTDMDTNKIANASFEILSSDKSSIIERKDVNNEEVTNQGGWSDVFNQRGSGYQSGLYYLQEVRVPIGYKKLIEDPIPFYINEDGTTTIPAKIGAGGNAVLRDGIAERDEALLEEGVVEVQMKHDYRWSPKSLIMFKVKNKKIKEYKFKIRKFPMYMENNDEITEDEYTSNNLLRNSNGKLAARIGFYIANSQTGATQIYLNQIINLKDGEFILGQGNNKFIPGTYYLSEDRAPQGYIQIKGVFKFEIFDTDQITISYTENVVRNSDGSLQNVNLDAVYTKLLVLNPDGTIQENPDNLNRDQYLKYIKYINVSKDTNDDNLLNINIKNNDFRLKVTKKSTLGDVVLSGASFQLFEGISGNKLIDSTKITDDSGIVQFKNLSSNQTYRLKELQAPTGHQLIDKEYLINIDENGQVSITNIDDKIELLQLDNSVIQVTVKNEPLESEYPSTGGYGNLYTTVIGLLCMGVSLIMMYSKRNNHKS